MIFYFLSLFFYKGLSVSCLRMFAKPAIPMFLSGNLRRWSLNLSSYIFWTKIRIFSRTKFFLCVDKNPFYFRCASKALFLWNVPYFSSPPLPHRPCRPTKMGPKPWFRHCGVQLEFALKLAPDPPPPPHRPPFRSHSFPVGYFPISNFFGQFFGIFNSLCAQWVSPHKLQSLSPYQFNVQFHNITQSPSH